MNKYQKDLDEKNRQIERLRSDTQSKNDIIAQLREEIEEMKSQGVQAPTGTKQKVERKQEYQSEPIEDDEPQHDEDEQDQDQENDEYEDDEYQEDVEQQDPNIIDEDAQEIEVEEQKNEPKGELKAIISDGEVEPLFNKLKLAFQRNKINYNSMGSAFPDPITIMKLEHKLKSLGMKDAEERLSLSRYIIEPRKDKKIEFIENRTISKENAENILKSKISNYSTYQYDAEEFNKRIREQAKRFSGTLRESFDLEDLDGNGYIAAGALKS